MVIRYGPRDVRKILEAAAGMYHNIIFMGASMKETDRFIQAYHEFRDAIDLTKAGMLPDLDNLVWYLVMGVPRVPADEDPSETAAMEAIDQRVMILKAVFAEANRKQPGEFIGRGLSIYDRAAKRARRLLEQGNPLSAGELPGRAQDRGRDSD